MAAFPARRTAQAIGRVDHRRRESVVCTFHGQSHVGLVHRHRLCRAARNLSRRQPARFAHGADALANDFRDSGYDVQRLIRVIVHPEAYQRACRQPGIPAAKVTTIGPPTRSSGWKSKCCWTSCWMELARRAIWKNSAGGWPNWCTRLARQFVTQMGTDDMAEVANFEETIPRSHAA